MTRSSAPFTPKQLLGLVGLFLSLFVVILGIVVPFFAPPVLKWESYRFYFKPLLTSPAAPVWLSAWPLAQKAAVDLHQLLCRPIVLGFLLGPWMALWGLFGALKQDAAKTRAALQQLLGCQLLLLVVLWIVWQSASLGQEGWKAWRYGVTGALHKYSFLAWAPGLLALGLALVTQSKARDLLGLVMAALAYHVLFLLAGYLYFAFVLAKLAPLRFQAPTQSAIQSYAQLWGTAIPVLAVLGTGLMSKGLRLRFHLIMTSPLWLPFFVVFFFWSLVIHTTLYFVEEITGVSWQPPGWAKLLILPWVCLPLFPLLLAVDFSLSLMRFLGQQVFDHFFPPDAQIAQEPKNSWVLGLGALLLLTLPIWILPVFVYWSIRLFIYESLLLPLLGRPQSSKTTMGRER